MTQPNILWICSDQQRTDTVGAYGNPFVTSPTIDQLAQNGTVFDNAFAQSPVCTPSRASMLTGRYPRTTRCRQNGQNIPASEQLITKLFAEAGYTCGLAGKLHLSACHPEVCSGPERRIDDGYATFRWSQAPGDEGWDQHDFRIWLESRGGDVKQPDHPLSKWVQFGRPVEKHQTTWCCEEAIDFIRQQAADGNPWFFSVHMFDPHHSFNPPATHLAKYLDRLDEVPLPDYVPGELAVKPPLQTVDHQGAYGGTCGFPYDEMNATDHRLVRAAYWAMCDLIDEQVGRIIDHLHASGQIENTIIIFSSDHGEMLGDNGIYLKGPYFYDHLTRVPLIISWPGQIQTQRVDGLVELVDLVPTLLEASSLPIPAGVQGRSLWPILTGAAESTQHRSSVYAEYYNAMPFHQNPTAQATMVRTQRYKIVVDHAYNTGELYDLVEDPGEHRNLWHVPGAIELKATMLQLLCDRMAYTVDPLPERLANW